MIAVHTDGVSQTQVDAHPSEIPSANKRLRKTIERSRRKFYVWERRVPQKR